jgi:histidine triad (HIT) family protein
MTSCVFCQISKRELPAKIVFEDNDCLAFEDTHPKAPLHLLVIPKRHVESLNELGFEDEGLLGHLIFIAKELALLHKVHTTGYRTVINTGPNAGQSVFHIHLHLLAGRPMQWPPG